MSSIQQIQQQVQEQIGKQKASEVLELELNGLEGIQFTDEIRKYFETFSNLQQLSLVSCNIKTLKNFPNLPNLVELILQDNELKGDQLQHLIHLQNIQALYLDGNQFSSIEDIKVLQKLVELKQLEMTENPLCEDKKTEDSYRKEVFKILNQLEIMNGQDKDGNEIDDEMMKEGDSDSQFDDDDEEGDDDDDEGEFDDEDDDDDDNVDQDEDDEDEDEDDDDDQEDQPQAKKKQ